MSQFPTTIQPPTMPGPMRDTNRPRVWHKVIGVIAIVLGALAVAGGLIGIGAPYMMSSFSKLVPAGMPNPYASFGEWANAMAVGNVVGAAVAGLLLLGGIKLVKRRPVGLRLLVIWAVLKMLFAIGMAILVAKMEYSMISTMMEQVQSTVASRNGKPTVPFPTDAFATGIAIFAGVFGLLWWWALPVFMLIWLGRKSVRADVASWPPMGDPSRRSS